ncbi:MAG: hypothetical protein LBB52_09800 [Desulfovibrio sp.]|jgi:tetratricopeptide (TPR) repeat protein|nr:hypothetical protein [Desulfovibrio sp.]
MRLWENLFLYPAVLLLTGLVCLRPLAAGRACAALAQGSGSVARAQETGDGTADEFPGGEAVFSADRSFRGAVRREAAEQAAFLAVRLEACFYAGNALIRAESPLFAALGDGLHENLPAALAWLIFPPRMEKIEVYGFPPHMGVRARLALRKSGRERELLREALKDMELVLTHQEIFSRLCRLLENYDRIAGAIFTLPPPGIDAQAQGTGLSPDAGAPVKNADAQAPLSMALRKITDNMQSLRILAGILPLSQAPDKGPDLRHPDKKNLARLEKELGKALELAPEDPVVLTAAAGYTLYLDRPAKAQEYAERALAAAPDYAPAHDIQGAILLRRGLPRLALRSFDMAVALGAKNPAFPAHRASAHFVLEEYADMCADLQAACALGDCEGLRRAKKSGKCPPPDAE